MLIGLNLLHAHTDVGGVWNYIKSLVDALGQYDHSNQYICYCTVESETLVPQKQNFKLQKVSFSGKNRFERIFYENSFLPIQIKRDKLDCLHWFANTMGFFCTIPSIVTIYDIMVYENSNGYSTLQKFYLKTMIPRTVRLARTLVPMSQSTADALNAQFNKADTHTIVIPPIVKDEFRPASPENINVFKTKYRLPDNFWLYVAHFYPHKNHTRLFQAYARIKAECNNYWPLVLRGDKKGDDGLIADLLDAYQIREDVIWLPRLDDNEMPFLYSSASALVFPSTFEGGGIPVVEAMACGCPVTASRIPTNLEFAGDAALLFDPLQVESIFLAMQQFTNDSELRANYRKIGLSVSEKLRSQKIVQKLLSAYGSTCRTPLR